MDAVCALPPDRVWIGGPTGEAKIEQAEDALGLRFPPDYREWVRAFGWGGPASLDLYGVDPAEDVVSDQFPSVVRHTLDSRADGLPAGLLVISSSGDGGVYAIDVDFDSPGTIRVWYPGSGQTEGLEVSDESFHDFISRAIETENELQDDD